ncbi:nucleotidyltransferase family protein [Aquihabitans sp. G128]|uniref:nucleotidyltransferase family protein n=1 Tax=Aquihabitans sp. G128 TaxID=2849779 RepID=UPI001C24A5CA|nr:nucleotidyltransferase family protein [Aquihabitans sp. G128]QXC60858.1 nucleotidyltransferase family protein [Aquihabitans sp. G128]
MTTPQHETGPGEVDRLAAIGWRLLLDHATVAVVRSLGTAGVDAILLKGPVIARWLYDAPDDRRYVDIDLLVAASDLDATRRVLAGQAFVLVSAALPASGGPHAETWFRERDHVAVDLHRCLHGLEHLEGDAGFDLVWRDHERLDLGGDAPLAVPGVAVRTLHAVLHLQPKDDPGSRAWVDLERAVSRVDLATWRAAAELAAEVGVREEVGPLLRLVDGGAALADELGLPSVPSAQLLRHHRRHAPRLDRLVRRIRGGSPAEVRRAIRMTLAPPPSRVRLSYPIARRGGLGLAAAYLWRIARFPWLVLESVRHRRRGGSTPRLR